MILYIRNRIQSEQSTKTDSPFIEEEALYANFPFQDLESKRSDIWSEDSNYQNLTIEPDHISPRLDSVTSEYAEIPK